jgi:hypothetical protein
VAQSIAPAATRSILSQDYSEASHSSSLAKLDLEVVNPLTDAGWDSLALSHPDAMIFHTSAWARVLARTYGHKPIYLKFSRGTKTFGLVPLMEVTSPFTGRRGVSVPFSDFCDPLFFDEPAQKNLWVDAIVDLGCQRRWRYVEFRGGETVLPPSASLAATYYGHTLDLSIGAEALFDRLSSPVRRALRKATKSGLTIDVNSSRSAMLSFYKLHQGTRRRHGLPPQPLSFFLNIYDEIIRPGLGFIVIANSSEAPIAAAIFFHSGRTALYKFGASDQRLQQLRGNNLVMWEAIRTLATKGVRRLYFGRTAAANIGLRRFKVAWGAAEQMIKYFRCSCDGRSSGGRPHEGGAFYNNIFRWLPIAASRGIGGMLYPHLD